MELPAGAWIETILKDDGTVSVITVPVAVDGPRLVAMVVNVTLLNTGTEAGNGTFEIPRSAAGLIRVVACAVLLAAFQSAPAELVTLAIFVMVPSTIGVTVIVTEAVPLLPSVPRLQVTTPFA